MMWNEWSLWLFGLILFLLLSVMLEAGFRLSTRWRSLHEGGGSDFLASATLGLLALLLGFTFSLALHRHEERRSLVIAEANALGTSWLRIQAIDAVDRESVAIPFRKYAETRLEWSIASDEGEASQAIYAQAAAQQQRVWSAATAALADGENIVDSKLLLDPLNESFDVATEREIRRQSHLPGAMVAMLLVFMLFATTLVGWRLGEVGKRMLLPSALTGIMLTLAVIMTMDLDMSTSGMITVSQDALVQALDDITKSQR
ncbi:hypothetical protein [Sphingorhabdus sp.]|uniref:hypothetical protein n=1 Tax=Sphingorhabdus sp. TaxID=1902408 RepID=UPI00391ADD6C